MIKRLTLLRSASVLLIAAATGHFMQNGSAIASRFSPEQPVTPTPSLASGMPMPPLTMNEPAVLPQAPDGLPGRLAALAIESGPATPDEVEAEPFQIACEPVLTAVPLSGAQIALTMMAPCNGGQNVIVEHAGMRFSQTLNPDGVLTVTFPALERDAQVLLRFDGGADYMTQTEVPTVADFARAVVQAPRDAGISLHALEFGASYDDAGHVWAGAPVAEGSLTRLGDGAMVAEVYTFAADKLSFGTSIELIVEAEVTAANCGRDITAQAMQIGPLTAAFSTDLTLVVPDCDAVGDYLVLNNLLQDLTIATN